jgi:hypothetical protein
MSPPNVLVNIPQIAQQRRGTPARMPFIVPITANAPTPRVSLHHTHASSSLKPAVCIARGPVVQSYSHETHGMLPMLRARCWQWAWP